MSDQQQTSSGNAVIATFFINNNQYYMSFNGKDFRNLGIVEGNSNGPYPPTDFQIQQVFPGYTLNYPLKTEALQALLKLFQTQTKGGNYVNAYVTPNGPTMIQGYFKVSGSTYYMTLGKSNFLSIGPVTIVNNVITPPTSDLIQSISAFKDIWWAEGANENELRNALFIIHSKPDNTGDDQMFILHVFSGPQ